MKTSRCYAHIVENPACLKGFAEVVKKSGQRSVSALSPALTNNAYVERNMALIPFTSRFRLAQVIAARAAL